MQKTSFHVLRVGMAITFLWIGILIFRDWQAWGGFVQPWVTDLLPFSLKHMMYSTAVLDLVIGACLLFGWFTWLAALVGSLHLFSVLLVSGINDVTVRDIAIVAGTLALFVDSVPESIKNKFSKKRLQ